jgi:hypothetical protein
MKYFDLNKRALNGKVNGTAASKNPEPESAGQDIDINLLSVARQAAMYVGTFIGVLLSTAVTHFQAGNTDLTLTVYEVVLSAVVAFVIIPVVYEKLQLNPGVPFVVQFGLFVQNGVFWHIIIETLGSAL